MEIEKNKNIEIVAGIGENLNISPVDNYLPFSKPKIRKENNEDIIIPIEKKIN